VMTPRAAAGDMRERVACDQKLGILFGAERKGLHNDDVALSDVVIEAPLNPAYSSLNLAQAVLLVGYEWYQAGVVKPPVEQVMGDTRPATREELAGFFGHLERELDDCGFLRPVEKRPTMVRNLRNIFLRANLTEQEVRTLRGVIVGLVKYGGRFRDDGN
jgi:tRNA/rRNA methyltransferase